MQDILSVSCVLNVTAGSVKPKRTRPATPMALIAESTWLNQSTARWRMRNTFRKAMTYLLPVLYYVFKV